MPVSWVAELSISDTVIGDVVEQVLIGGGIGLLVGVPVSAWIWFCERRSSWPFTVMLAMALAGISFYPALSLTPFVSAVWTAFAPRS